MSSEIRRTASAALAAAREHRATVSILALAALVLTLAEYLLNEAGVALVPGSAFGAPGQMRLSFATSMKVLEDAIERIKSAVEG